MIGRMLTNTMVRKIVVFAVVFAAAVAFMGTLVLREPDPDWISRSVRPIPVGKPASRAPELIRVAVPAQLPAEKEDIAQIIEYQYSPPAGWDGGSQGFCYLPELSLSEELQRYTHDKCQEMGLEYTLVLALMWRESGFQTQAVGHNTNGTSDSGIMQINDVNKEWLYRDLSIDNLLDPYQNIDAGTEILSRFTIKHGTHNALLAYQYGENGMLEKRSEGMTTNAQVEKLYQKKAEFDEMLRVARE